MNMYISRMSLVFFKNIPKFSKNNRRTFLGYNSTVWVYKYVNITHINITHIVPILVLYELPKASTTSHEDIYQLLYVALCKTF